MFFVGACASAGLGPVGLGALVERGADVLRDLGHVLVRVDRRHLTLLVVVVHDGLGVLVEGLEAVPQRRRLVVRALDQRLARQLLCACGCVRC